MTEAQMEMPSFDFSGETITDAELEAELAKAAGGKYLRPGLHETKIQAIAFDKKNAIDERWTDLKITLAGQEGKTVSTWLSIPTRGVKFKKRDGTETLREFKRCAQFVSALGMDLKAGNLGQVIPQVFSDLKKLVDVPLKTRVGYPGAYAKFVKKEGDASTYNVVLRDGNLLAGADGKPIVFPDFAACEAHCKNNKIFYSKFCDALEFEPSSTPAQFGADTGW